MLPVSIDHQARLDAHDLLARFCNYLDHGLADRCADLFLANATLQCNRGPLISGKPAIAAMVKRRHDDLDHATRHIIQGIFIDRGEGRRDMTVHASGPVLDLSRNGMMMSFHDYVFQLHYVCSWRISHVAIQQTSCTGAEPFSAFAAELPVEPLPMH
jgi:hypothetical protein